MPPTINLVVTCTERKTLSAPSRLRFRTIPSRTLERNCAEWVDRLQNDPSPTLPAFELYSGNHWYIVQRIISTHAGHAPRIQLWIASAGYGLISAHALVHSYMASFAPGLDSVGTADYVQDWWRMLSRWSGPTPHSPRSLRDLANAHPRSCLMVVASATYSRALQEDLLEASAVYRGADRLALFSAGLPASSPLSRLAIDVDARHQQIVGGQMHSLNARLAEYALSRWPDWEGRIPRLRDIFAREHGDLPARVQHNRTPHSDARIQRWIARQLKQSPAVGHSKLLRVLRTEGIACEQNRFKRLFSEMHSRTKA